MARSLASRCPVADGPGLGRRGGGLRDHPGLGSAHPLADGHGAHALRDVAGGVQAGKQERDRAGAAEGPRRNQGRFQAGQDAAGAVAGQAAHHDRRPYQGGNADPADPDPVEGIPAAAGERRSPAQAPGGTCRVSRSSARPWPARKISTNSIMRSPRPLPRWSSTACWPNPLEKLKGFNQKTIEVYSAENPAERREVEVSEVVVDPEAIRQQAGRGTQLEGDRRPGLHLARAAALASRPSR